MAQLRQDYLAFTAREAEILVVSPEDAESVRGFWQAERLPMVGMADPDHGVANAYGQRLSLLQLGRLPSLVVLDRTGVVRFEHRGAHMADFPTNRTLLALLDTLNREQAAGVEHGRKGQV